MFAVQDDVTSGIVGALHPQLLFAEAQSYRRQPPNSLDAWGLVVRGMMALISFTKENLDKAVDLATRAVERAVQLNPNLAMAHGLLGLGYASIDRPTEGLEHVTIALRLSPRDPMAYLFFGAQALCKFVAEDFSGAILSAEAGLRINTNSSDNYLYMAAALAELGETERAKKQIERALRVVPKITLQVIARGIPEGRGWERYHAGLRKAGLPE
jgi:tetratricopeptide (TPR) repeat protein